MDKSKEVERINAMVEARNLPFDDKGSYLMWVKRWKHDYARITQIIRKLKNARKTVHMDESDALKITEDDVKFCESAAQSRFADNLWTMQRVAYDKLVVRAASKVLAGILREENLNALPDLGENSEPTRASA